MLKRQIKAKAGERKLAPLADLFIFE